MTAQGPSAGLAEAPMSLVGGVGARLFDAAGRSYIDFMAANGAVSLGHGFPVVKEAVRAALDQVWLSAFLPTPIREQTVAAIDAVLPKPLTTAVLYSTGAESMEAALRPARLLTGGTRFITFKQHFHGKTTALIQMLHRHPPCYGPDPEPHPIALTVDDNLAEALERVDPTDLAGVICEPVLGASGPRRLPDTFLPTLRAFCDRRGLPLIVDEVLCGLYRGDGWFVAQSRGVTPDILCFGKGLANGLPISVVAVSPVVARVLPECLPGSTFSGGTLPCAAACAVLAYLTQHDPSNHVAGLAQRFFAHMRHWEQRRGVCLDLDGTGAMLSLAWRATPLTPRRIADELAARGVLVSPSAERLRLLPPLTISHDLFEQGLTLMTQCFDHLLDLDGQV